MFRDTGRWLKPGDTPRNPGLPVRLPVNLNQEDPGIDDRDDIRRDNGEHDEVDSHRPPHDQYDPGGKIAGDGKFAEDHFENRAQAVLGFGPFEVPNTQPADEGARDPADDEDFPTHDR